MATKRKLKLSSKPVIRKTLPPLREEEMSAFTHGIWNRYDLIRLMQWSAKVLDMHHDQFGKYSYSAVQDAFYALSGLKPNQSPAGKAWDKVIAAPGFEDLRDLMSDQFGQSAAVLELAHNFEKYMMQPPDEQQAQEDDADAEQEQEQEQPEEPEQEQPEEPEQEQPEEQDAGDDAGDDGGQGEGDQEGQGEGQEDASNGADDDQPDQEQENASEAQGNGSGGQQKNSNAGDGGDGGDETIEASPKAGRGVIKREGQRGAARQVVNAQVVESASSTAEAVSAVYSFLMDPPKDREARANELVDLNLLSLQSLVGFLGWMRRVVKGARRRGAAAVGEFTGFRPGNWSSHTHPMDMAEVAKGNPIYLARMAEGQLTNRVYTEDRPLGKGPVIILRDESDSMDSDAMIISGKSCTLHQAALSFEVALAKTMNGERRDLVSIAWSSADTRQYTYGEKGMDDHWATFIGGGTRIEPALERALKVAKEYVRGADILILTDGDLQMDPRNSHLGWDQHCVELLQEYRERGGRVWAICINSRPQNMAHKLAWVDGWVSIEDMRAGEKVADLLEKMAADRIPAKGRMRV